MDLALLIIAAKAFLKKGTARELKIGESCPQDNTFYLRAQLALTEGFNLYFLKNNGLLL